MVCPSAVKHSILTVFADIDGFLSAAGGAPNVRFFVLAVSAPSRVSMLESVVTPIQKANNNCERNLVGNVFSYDTDFISPGRRVSNRNRQNGDHSQAITVDMARRGDVI